MPNWNTGQQAIDNLQSLGKGDTFAVKYPLSYGPVVKHCRVTKGPHTHKQKYNDEYVLVHCVSKPEPSVETDGEIDIKHRQSSTELLYRETHDVEYPVLAICVETPIP